MMILCVGVCVGGGMWGCVWGVCVCVFHLKVCMHRNTAGGAQQVTRRVGRQWHKMAEAVDQLIQLPYVRAAMMKETVRDIQRECAALCRKDSTSLFKLKSPKDIKCFSTVEQEKELVKDAPTFLTILNAAANNSKQLQQNNLKTARMCLAWYYICRQQASYLIAVPCI